MVNQTLISIRSQIELKRKFLAKAKGCSCCTIWAAFLSSGRLSMFHSWHLSRFISRPSRFLILQSLLKHCHHSFCLDCIRHWSCGRWRKNLTNCFHHWSWSHWMKNLTGTLRMKILIDPSAIVNSFLGTDFERSQVCL